MPDSWDYSQHSAARERAGSHMPVLTWLVFVLCVVFTLANQTSHGRPGSFWYEIGHFGFLPAQAIWDGRYTALLTSVFVHGNPGNPLGTLMHIGFNMIIFVRLGSVLEETINPLLWALFFVCAAVVGAGAELAVSGQTGVGASGVVYALIGLMYVGRGRYPQWRTVVTQQLLNTAVIWGLFCVVATWTNALHIANAAHGGGFLFGLAVGWLFIAKRYRIAAALAIAGLLALTVVSVTWVPWSAEWTYWKANREAQRGHYDTAIAWYRRTLNRVSDLETRGEVWQKIIAVEILRNDPEGAKKVLAEAESDLSQRAAKADESKGKPTAPDQQ